MGSWKTQDTVVREKGKAITKDMEGVTQKPSAVVQGGARELDLEERPYHMCRD